MKNKDAVIFAGWFPDLERSSLYIDDMKKVFPHEDIYFGINPAGTNFHKTLPLIGYDQVAEVSDERVVTSDASAFQAALKLFKDANTAYDTVHFIHTKGMSYKDHNAWMSSYESYFRGYFRQLAAVRNNFATEPTIGGVSYVGRKEPMNGSGYSTALDKYAEFPTTEVENIMSLLTFYSMRGTLLQTFVNNVNDSFFTDKLDRYFFETSFPLIVDRMGWKRKHLVMW